jgi:hypothetical protein
LPEHPDSTVQPRDDEPDFGVFLTAATFNGSDWTTWGRGLRSRKPSSQKSRWHCRTPRTTPYRLRRCSDNTGPSHRVAARSKLRGVLRNSDCNLRQSFASSVRGRPDRSPSRRASKPPSSKRFTQRCTVLAAGVPCRHQQQPVQSVVVARLLTTLNLLLDRYSRHLSILDLQLAHRLYLREKNRAMIPQCCILYVVMFNDSH